MPWHRKTGAAHGRTSPKMPAFIDGRAIPIGRKHLAVTRRFYSI
ncbi:MAG: hypothetical protein ABSG77_07125 [Candidatus Acidiferrum sp.]